MPFCSIRCVGLDDLAEGDIGLVGEKKNKSCFAYCKFWNLWQIIYENMIYN